LRYCVKHPVHWQFNRTLYWLTMSSRTGVTVGCIGESRSKMCCHDSQHDVVRTTRSTFTAVHLTVSTRAKIGQMDSMGCGNYLNSAKKLEGTGISPWPITQLPCADSHAVILCSTDKTTVHWCPAYTAFHGGGTQRATPTNCLRLSIPHNFSHLLCVLTSRVRQLVRTKTVRTTKWNWNKTVFWNCFKTVLFQFHFAVRIVYVIRPQTLMKLKFLTRMSNKKRSTLMRREWRGRREVARYTRWPRNKTANHANDRQRIRLHQLITTAVAF